MCHHICCDLTMLFIYCYFNILVKLSLYFPFVRYFASAWLLHHFKFYCYFILITIIITPTTYESGLSNASREKSSRLFLLFSPQQEKVMKLNKIKDIHYAITETLFLFWDFFFLSLWDCDILPLESNLNQSKTKRNRGHYTPQFR